MFNSNRLIKNTRLNKLYKQNLIDVSQSSRVWELLFTSEVMWNGYEVKFITLIDQVKKTILSIEAREINASVESQVLSMFEGLGQSKQLPSLLVYDHSAFISIGLDKWCRDHSVKQFYLYSRHSTPSSFFTRYSRRRNMDAMHSFDNKTSFKYR